MTIIYLLIPLSLVLTAAAIAAFFWAVRSGQFDDLNTPALKILHEEPVSNVEGKVVKNKTDAEES
jgi:cbb3-type cytochrome oxidase maturation protein